MAYIKKILENELIGGTDNTDVYPVTTSQAIFRQNPDGHAPEGVRPRLEDTLQDHEEDAQELHRKTEKLVVYLDNNKKDQTLEITGNVNTVSLTGRANIETFGDEPSQTISAEEMNSKNITVTRGSDVIYNQDTTTASVAIPDVVGIYTSTFTCTYNGTTKSINNKVNVNLRKYFGFSVGTPSDVISLSTSNFSNTVACTVTVAAINEGFQRIYFAVPQGMTIDRVIQPDALNAPLAITQIGTTERVIGGVSYTYKLYQSVDLIDSSKSKRLTIS